MRRRRGFFALAEIQQERTLFDAEDNAPHQQETPGLVNERESAPQ
jgi:hypothetical protein